MILYTRLLIFFIVMMRNKRRWSQGTVAITTITGSYSITLWFLAPWVEKEASHHFTTPTRRLSLVLLTFLNKILSYFCISFIFGEGGLRDQKLPLLILLIDLLVESIEILLHIVSDILTYFVVTLDAILVMNQFVAHFAFAETDKKYENLS